MSFGVCNAPTSFQRCILNIFSDWKDYKSIHGWLDNLQETIWWVFVEFEDSVEDINWKRPSAKLRKVSIHDNFKSSVRSYHC